MALVSFLPERLTERLFRQISLEGEWDAENPGWRALFLDSSTLDHTNRRLGVALGLGLLLWLFRPRRRKPQPPRA